MISQLPYIEMLKTTAADFHPPGYYTVVELLYKFFPPTEIVTRSISILFYLLTLLLIFKLASEIKGKVFGVISTLVVAFNPIFFTYAFEARNYTMFAFAATGSIYFLVKLSALRQAQGKKGFWPSVLFVAFSTLGIYTHYYMFFTLAAQGLYLVLFDRKIFWLMVWLYVVTAILYLPWIPFLYSQVTSVGESYWIGSIDKRTHFEAFLRILGGEHQNAYRPWLFALSIALLAVGLIQHILRHHFEKPYLLIWLWAIVPFIVATLPGYQVDGFKFPFRPIFFWRYLINASVPLSMVMIHTGQRLPKYLFWFVVAVLLILSLVIDIQTFKRYPEGFKQIYEQKVAGQIKKNDKIVTVLPSFGEVLYYRNRFGLNNGLIVLPEGLVQFSGKSLLDAYVANGTVKIDDNPTGRYFEMRPGPMLEVRIKD